MTLSWLALGEIESAVTARRPARRDLMIYQPPARGYRDGTFPVKVLDAPDYGPPTAPTVANWAPWKDTRVRQEKF